MGCNLTLDLIPVLRGILGNEMRRLLPPNHMGPTQLGRGTSDPKLCPLPPTLLAPDSFSAGVAGGGAARLDEGQYSKNQTKESDGGEPFGHAA